MIIIFWLYIMNSTTEYIFFKLNYITKRRTAAVTSQQCTHTRYVVEKWTEVNHT